jgi:CheY-like chemotaxis protein
MAKKQKILIVDDEQNIRKLVKASLEADYTVLEAADGKQALDKARVETPDLILLDIMMPEMDGYTTCSALKSDPITKEIPVVMLTAVQYELNEKLAEQLGAIGYIRKPFTRQELLVTISNTLTKH